MSVDEFVKLVLGLAVAFAIIGIAFQLMRLLGKTVDIVEEVKRPAKNIGDLSDMLVEDYNSVRGIVKDISKFASSIRSFVSGPSIGLGGIFNLLGKLRGKSSEEETEK
jgi:hypothetical protein